MRTKNKENPCVKKSKKTQHDSDGWHGDGEILYYYMVQYTVFSIAILIII